MVRIIIYRILQFTRRACVPKNVHTAQNLQLVRIFGQIICYDNIQGATEIYSFHKNNITGEDFKMFELIAIIGLSAVIISCAVNLFELAIYEPEQETEISQSHNASDTADKSASAKEFIA